MRATKPSVLREKLQVLSFLPNVGSCAGDGVYSEVVSQPLLPSLTRFASCLLDVKGSLCQFLGFFSEELVLCKTATDFMCLWEDVGSGSKSPS